MNPGGSYSERSRFCSRFRVRSGERAWGERRRWSGKLLLGLSVLLIMPWILASRQQGRQGQTPSLEKLDDHQIRLGEILIDTQARTVTVPGRVNPNVSVLEFLANAKGSEKTYESALELETDAISYNLALILIGLDPKHSKPATSPFEPGSPTGDPVEVWIEVLQPGGTWKTIPAEQLVFDTESKTTLPSESWVYTGSRFQSDGVFMAALEGVLITFVHHPSPLIDHTSMEGAGPYGTLILNPHLGLDESTVLRLVVRALPRGD